jgi:hypothetical protein
MIFEQQASIEAGFNKRDEIYSYFTKETTSFSRVTQKILTELINQNKALQKKCTKLFTNLDNFGQTSSLKKEPQRQFMHSQSMQGFKSPRSNDAQVNQLKSKISEMNNIISTLKSIGYGQNNGGTAQFDKEIFEGLKANLQASIQRSSNKLASVYSLLDDRLSIYDDRIKNAENLLTQKIKFGKLKRSDSSSSMLNNYVDQLNNKVANLEGKLTELEFE